MHRFLKFIFISSVWLSFGVKAMELSSRQACQKGMWHTLVDAARKISKRPWDRESISTSKKAMLAILEEHSDQLAQYLLCKDLCIDDSSCSRAELSIIEDILVERFKRPLIFYVAEHVPVYVCLHWLVIAKKLAMNRVYALCIKELSDYQTCISKVFDEIAFKRQIKLFLIEALFDAIDVIQPDDALLLLLAECSVEQLILVKQILSSDAKSILCSHTHAADFALFNSLAYPLRKELLQYVTSCEICRMSHQISSSAQYFFKIMGSNKRLAKLLFKSNLSSMADAKGSSAEYIDTEYIPVYRQFKGRPEFGIKIANEYTVEEFSNPENWQLRFRDEFHYDTELSRDPSALNSRYDTSNYKYESIQDELLPLGSLVAASAFQARDLKPADRFCYKGDPDLMRKLRSCLLMTEIDESNKVLTLQFASAADTNASTLESFSLNSATDLPILKLLSLIAKRTYPEALHVELKDAPSWLANLHVSAPTWEIKSKLLDRNTNLRSYWCEASVNITEKDDAFLISA